MDQELKNYLDEKLQNLATKNDINRLEGNFKQLEGNFDRLEGGVKQLEGGVARLERKNDRAHKDLLNYMEHIDTELQEHRHNSEIHKPAYSS